MDKYKIDSQKIAYHPERIHQWNEAKDDWEKAKSVYPLYVEISPVGHCNHRCLFCGVDYLGYKKSPDNITTLLERIKEMGAKGIKSVMLAGDGEPLLSPHIPQILTALDDAGIDSALTTNLSVLSDEQAYAVMKFCKWVKVSFNGGTPQTYSQIHQTSEKHFYNVLDNIKKCIEIRNRYSLRSTIGVQTVLLPENEHTISEITPLLKKLGVDYYTIKPFSQHSFSENRQFAALKYLDLEHIKNLNHYSDENFQFIFRENAFTTHQNNQISYTKCSATPFFWAYVMATGDVYACSAYLKQEEFLLGNIFEETFEQIWGGEKRKACFEYVTKKLDISTCRKNCRMNSVNQYLDVFNNPPDHLNFI